MLDMGGDDEMTICMKCNHRVHTAPGFCTVCGEVFPTAVILRQVAPAELQHRLEMERYARILGGHDWPSGVIITRLARLAA